MKNHLKIIVYLMPFLICFSLFSFKGFCASIALDPTEAGVLTSLGNGAFGNALDIGFSATNPEGLLIGLDKMYNEDLNPYLYQTYGWDLEDISWEVEDTLSKPTTLSILAGNSTVGNGYNILSARLGDLAIEGLSSLWGNAKAYILGQLNQAQDTIVSTTNKAIVWWNSVFNNNMISSRQHFVDNGTIVSNSQPFLFSLGYFAHFERSGTAFDIQWTTNFPCYYFGDANSSLKACVPADFCTDGPYNKSYRFNANVTDILTNISTHESTTFNYNNLLIRNARSFIVGNKTFYYGDVFEDMGYLYSYYQLDNNMGTITDISNYITSQGYDEGVITAVGYSDKTVEGTAVDIDAILDLLRGHWVDTDSLGRIRDLLDGGIVIPDDETGVAEWGLTDEQVAELEGIIEGVIDRDRELVDELGAIDDSGTADPDDPDDDKPDYTDTGITVPDNFPETTFDTVNDIISSPLEFFSIFEPIFMIFGANTIMIFSLWLFVPCVIIIGFIIWALK